MGYPVEYPIPSGPISRDGMGKSSLNTIPLKRYRDGFWWDISWDGIFVGSSHGTGYLWDILNLKALIAGYSNFGFFFYLDFFFSYFRND